MASDSTWLARCAWKLRSSEFRALREVRDSDGEQVVAMEYTPLGDNEVWAQTRRRWSRLPSTDEIIPVVGNEPNEPLLLRYAAIDWHHVRPKLGRDHEATRCVARQAFELTQVFEVIYAGVPEFELGWLACPRILFDLEGEIRIVFAPARPRDLPPEAVARWPHADERALIWIVGRAVHQLVRGKRIKAPALAATIARCFDPHRERFETLRQLRDVLCTFMNGTVEPSMTSPFAWMYLETGLGLLALGRRELALRKFEQAREADPYSVAAARCIRATGGVAYNPYVRPQRPALGPFHVDVPLGIRSRLWPVVEPRPEPRPEVEWVEASEKGARLEAARDFEGAVALYHLVRRDDANRIAVDLAFARCYLHLRSVSHALDHATRVLDADPDHVVALAVRTHALLLAKRSIDALASAEAWASHAPDDGLAVYARGRSLFVMGRLEDARAAFERASVLAPNLLEAQLMRREVDRCIGNVHSTVGTQPAIALDLPDHLARLRDAFVAGSTDAALEFLRQPEYREDPVAQLLLAGCQMFERRFDEALAIYEHVATTWDEHRPTALIGQARALVELDRAADALAILDAAPSDDANVFDVRACALERLGRTAEAALELQKGNVDRQPRLGSTRTDSRANLVGSTSRPTRQRR